MNLSVRSKSSRYEKGTIRDAVSFALNSAASNARQRFEHYAGLCKKFEKKHKMTSAKFMENFEAGKLGDEITKPMPVRPLWRLDIETNDENNTPKSYFT
mgnify:CR=1 FL=1